MFTLCTVDIDLHVLPLPQSHSESVPGGVRAFVHSYRYIYLSGCCGIPQVLETSYLEICRSAGKENKTTG